jgi:hypothetical protein
MGLEIKESVLDDNGVPVQEEQETTPEAQQESSLDSETQPESETTEGKNTEVEASTAEEGESEPKGEEPTEPAKETEASQEVEDEELTEEEVYAVVSEMLPNMQYKSFEEIKQALTQKQEPLPESLQKQKEWLDNGGTLKEFYEMNMVDFDEMSDQQLVEREIKRKYPSYTEAEIAEEIESLYGIQNEDHEDYNEREAKNGLRRMKGDAHNFRSQEKSRVEKFKTDLSSKKPEPSEVDQAEREKNQQAFIQDYTNAAKNFEGFEFDQGFKFKLDDAYKNELSKYTSQGDPLADFVGKNGEINYDRLVAAKVLMDKFEDISKDLIKHGMSLQNKETIKNAKNPSHESKNEGVPVVKKSGVQQVFDQLPSFR